MDSVTFCCLSSGLNFGSGRNKPNWYDMMFGNTILKYDSVYTINHKTRCQTDLSMLIVTEDNIITEDKEGMCGQ